MSADIGFPRFSPAENICADADVRTVPSQVIPITLSPTPCPFISMPPAIATIGRQEIVDLEVIIPAFNEANRLPETLRQAVTYLETQSWRSRLVVVDNGSVDGTVAAARTARSERVEIRVIGCSRPGKGAAVRRGLLTSTAPLVGFIDADLSTPLDTLSVAVDELRRGAVAVIASRYAPGGRFVGHRPFGRRLGSAAFRMLARPLVAHVQDTQCGFKFFHREVVLFALQRCKLACFAFDVELLQQIQIAGGRIVEVPVAWTDDSRSTFRPLCDGLTSFSSLFKLYRNGL
jgi:dolichyl-phosphate beta-glucosyltransferase